MVLAATYTVPTGAPQHSPWVKWMLNQNMDRNVRLFESDDESSRDWVVEICRLHLKYRSRALKDLQILTRSRMTVALCLFELELCSERGRYCREVIK
ncbi:hypothetical protein SAMN05660916_02950 [Arthrobacter sp. 31Cvi3.1E]|nr:hypothetical protein SAMN05660916_02950 [Arthrobacter sp. 31Cvi3.1E]